MYPHTSTKIKLQKQIILIDIFYVNNKENLYFIFDSNAFKGDSNTPIITKTEGFITKTGAS